MGPGDRPGSPQGPLQVHLRRAVRKWRNYVFFSKVPFFFTYTVGSARRFDGHEQENCRVKNLPKTIPAQRHIIYNETFQKDYRFLTTQGVGLNNQHHQTTRLLVCLVKWLGCGLAKPASQREESQNFSISSDSSEDWNKTVACYRSPLPMALGILIVHSHGYRPQTRQ